MDSAMEWHDSEIISIDAHSGAESAILLDAYVYRRVETAGATQVEGGNQRVRIGILSMLFVEQLPDLPIEIYAGALVLGGIPCNNLVPLPLRFNGEVTLTIDRRDDGQQLLFSGTAMSIETDGEFRFVEVVPFNPFDEA